MSNPASRTLYERLGGYDAIAAVVGDFAPRLMADPQLGRFWQNRGQDGIQREKQLLIDYLCNAAGGPVYYTGRDMKMAHEGMRIGETDWQIMIDHLTATLERFNVPAAEKGDVLAFVESTKAEIVELP